MRKRIISLALAAVIIVCCTLTPLFAFADSTSVWEKYSENGSHKVSTFTFSIDGENDYTYKVWYPSDINSMSARPVILYCNGTGSTYGTLREWEDEL